MLDRWFGWFCSFALHVALVLGTLVVIHQHGAPSAGSTSSTGFTIGWAEPPPRVPGETEVVLRDGNVAERAIRLPKGEPSRFGCSCTVDLFDFGRCGVELLYPELQESPTDEITLPKCAHARMGRITRAFLTPVRR